MHIARRSGRQGAALTLCLATLFASCALVDRADRPENGLESFDAAWQIIHDQHFDPDFNGVDWHAVREEYRPQAEAAGSMKAVRTAIQGMLARLGQSHFALIEKERLKGGALSSKTTPAGTAGLDIRYRDDTLLVSRVDPAGPAEAAGVQPGWILTAVDGVPVEETIDALPPNRTEKPQSAIRTRLLARIDGEVGSVATLAFDSGADGAAQPLELAVTRGRRDATPLDLPGLPTIYLHMRQERINRDGLTIGLVHWSHWFGPVVGHVEKALFSLRDCDGIVLDLRGNPGGVILLADRVAGHFIAERASLGIQRSRRIQINHRVRPRRSHDGQQVEPFAGPLAILSDETTGSSSEVFAGGMQALGRARVIGESSAGTALPATLTELPNGDYLLHAISDFVTSRGESLEGNGVTPDQIVPLTRAPLLAGRDPQFDAAADWIASQFGR